MPSCPTCGREVSDEMDFCPYCGGRTRPYRRAAKEVVKEAKILTLKKLALFLGCLLFFFVFLPALLFILIPMIIVIILLFIIIIIVGRFNVLLYAHSMCREKSEY